MPHEPGQAKQEIAEIKVQFQTYSGVTSALLHAVSLIFRIQSCYTCRRCYFSKHRNSCLPIAILPCAEVAQLAEHSPEKAGVGSSILPLGTNISYSHALSPLTSILKHDP